MILKKIFSFSNKKQIWRIIPSETNKVILEQRTIDKQVFFTCMELKSGEMVFQDYQLDEKYWIGIEAVHNDIIYFHKYVKPDMPRHKGIIAVDIFTQKVLWQNEEYNFSFIYKDKIYCMRELFESIVYFTVNYMTGDVIDELGNDSIKISSIKSQSDFEHNYDSYKFSERWDSFSDGAVSIKNILDRIVQSENVVGIVEYVQTENVLMMSLNISENNSLFTNSFKAIEVDSENIIFEEKLVEHSKTIMPDSFFLKDNFLFLLKGKTCFDVYSIIK